MNCGRLLAMSGLFLCACAGSGSESPTGPGLDAGTDSGVDSGTDASVDSGTEPGMDASTDSGVSERRIFITNAVRDAALGGTDGADALCAAEARDAALGGEFKAWLSTISSPVSERLTHSTVPYVRVDGTMVANDWDDLVDGAILAPINLNANGELRSGDTWTGTLSTGAAYLGDDCVAFTDATARLALCGSSAATNAAWTASMLPRCDSPLRLYCIEQ